MERTKDLGLRCLPPAALDNVRLWWNESVKVVLKIAETDPKNNWTAIGELIKGVGPNGELPKIPGASYLTLLVPLG